MRLGLGLHITGTGVSQPFSVALTGLTNGEAIIGDHASIGYTTDPVSATETVKWSNSANPADAATYGTGANPTDYTAGDEGLLYLHVTDNVASSGTLAPESGLTATTTFAQDSVITLGTGVGEVDNESDAVFAFTVPSGWVAGASQGGIVVNLGGFTGALLVLDDAGRIFVGATGGGQIISTAGAVTGGARVVVQIALGDAIKVWIDGVAVHGGALEESSLDTVNAVSFSGGNDSGYISRTAGTVTNGQQSVTTNLADFSLWTTYGNLAVEQAPVGTWGDLTYYKSQSVTDTVGSETVTVTRSALIRYARGTAPAVADGQTWTVDDTSVNIDASASGANLTFTYAASGLPAGLSINSGTGAITGTATVASSGTVTVTATDQYGLDYTDTFTFTGSLRTQATGGADLDLLFTVDEAITSTNLIANWTTNGNTLTLVSVSPTLPSGLSVNSAGTMTGTPTVPTSDATYTLTMQDEYGRETSDTFTLEVTAASFALASFFSGAASSDAITHARAGNATMIDSDGLLKWAPHNLALNSATPATQSIAVVSGADYTVECTGVSIALSGAGTGTVTEGSPVTITASTGTLTLTVTGSSGTMWAYRSDLGGMVNNPDRGDSYVPTTSTAVYLPRRGHHIWDGAAWVNEGLLHESEARTNLLHTTDALVTQSLTVTNTPHTLHFTGTGTVTLSGASTAGPLVGTGTGENNRVSLTFTPTAGSLTLTVSGTVTNAQLEEDSTLSSHIPNIAASGSVTRAADTLTIPAANLPWPTPNVIGPELVTNGTFDADVSGWTLSNSPAWVSGRVELSRNGGIDIVRQSFATTIGAVYRVTADVTGTRGKLAIGVSALDDSILNAGFLVNTSVDRLFVATTNPTWIYLITEVNGTSSWDNISVREIDPLAVSIQMQGTATGEAYTAARWYADANNYITQEINSSDFTFEQSDGGTIDAVTGGAFSPGVNVPFNIASRHGSTFINGAVDGTALTADTTPVALPDLETTDLDLGFDYMGTIKQFRVWGRDIGDTGIEEASS